MPERLPQVDFFIGEKSLSVPANHLNSFVFEDTVAMAGDSFTLEFIDPTWKILESDLIPSLARNLSKSVAFRYGWGADWMSQLRYGTVTEFVPAEITRGGIRITMKGFDSVSGSVKSQSRVQKTYQGKISKVVADVALENGWETDIEETIQIQEMEGRKKGKQPRIWRKNNKTDLEFLNELAQRAKSVEGGGGYRVFLDSTQTPPVLHFHPDRGHKYPLHREYVVQTDSLGEVITFVPSVDGTSAIYLGASKTSLLYRDPSTRKLTEREATPQSETDGIALGPKTTRDGTAPVRQAIPPSSREEAEARLGAFYEGLSWASSKAQLEVVGDPYLEPGRIISVVVKTPSNLKYFISGLYLIEKVVHNVSPGGYSSQMSLIKNGFDVGDLQQEKGVVQRGQ